MGVNWGVWVLCGLIVIILALGSVAYANLSNDIDQSAQILGGRMSALENYSYTLANSTDSHNALSRSSKTVGLSTVLILIRSDNITTEETSLGAVYTDSDGHRYIKGTGFSIGEGRLLTARHVISSVNELGTQNVFIAINGMILGGHVVAVVPTEEVDLGVVITDLNISSVAIDNDEIVNVGSEIGFIGYPLESMTPTLSDGIVSGMVSDDGKFFDYTINSFVNRGNSGGPVFVADTGKVIGIISSRQFEPLVITPPNVRPSELTPGERAIMDMQISLSQQLAANSQVGIGRVVRINSRLVENLKSQVPPFSGNLVQP